MKHNIRFDEEIGAVRIKIIGEVTPDDAVEVLALSEKLGKNKETCGWIIDLSEGSSGLSKETRKVFKEMDTAYASLKVALVGTTPVTRMIAKIVMAAIGQAKNTRFCKTDAEALAWLKGEK